jgi:hypothetical protein
MPHTIEVAKSGRASCRTCKQTIAKGELRFGEEVQTQFSDAPSLQWHHLMCAAKNKPAQLTDALAQYPEEIPDRAALEKTIEDAKKTQKPGQFPYADRAPTGRAKCIECRETIEKGSLRVAVEREVDTGAFMGKSAAYLHPRCAAKAIEGGDVYEKIRANSLGLEERDLAELKKELESADAEDVV